ncbi:hypothetical protein ACFOEE_14245 [Pseudoalteromonas fenneropenaei]|uniref:Solute-binding protein family 3/N-terminal domain-containing protein n=1 Tax=Pseudoalteromonas fenneropenaei TaxID=1737459 RepID=A0ABV7CMD1_9GAMM
MLIAVAKAPTAQAHFGVVAKPTLDWYQKRSPLLLERVKAGFVVGSAPLQLQFAANDEATKKCQAFNEFLTDFIGSEAYRKILRQYQPQT